MKQAALSLLLLFFAGTLRSQKVYPVWPGIAPGSENWKWQEQIDTVELKQDALAYNIVQPTLTFYPAEPALANGVTVIICPGGSFCYLHVDTEGSEVAKWLNKKGVSAFVLKYRLIHSETSLPRKERDERMKDPANAAKLVTPLVPLAIADARQAIGFVRKNATGWNLDPHKIGIMGFSAGGTLAAAAAFGYNATNRPDFVAPIYAYVPPSLQMTVLPDAPPLFVAAASDDELKLVPMSVNLYSSWLAAGHPAELHIYSKGGHGFGMNRQNQPSDSWIDRFGDWLKFSIN